MKQQSIFINNLWRFATICALALVVFSCKSKKVTTEIADESLNTRRIISEHLKAEPNFKTMASRVQITYDDGKSKQRVNANFRIKKDEIIWMKASILGITVAKAMLTPDSVSIYETVSKRYFEGDYRFISSKLGVELNFKQVQALLLGQSTIELKPNAIIQSISDNKYILEPKIHHELFKQNVAIYPNNFKIANQTVEQVGQNRIFTLDYSDYQKVEEAYYPSDINLQSIDDKKIIRLHLQVRKVDVNPDLGFPYEIPNGYKQMQLD